MTGSWKKESFYIGIQANRKVSFHSLNGRKKHTLLLTACSWLQVRNLLLKHDFEHSKAGLHPYPAGLQLPRKVSKVEPKLLGCLQVAPRKMDHWSAVRAGSQQGWSSAPRNLAGAFLPEAHRTQRTHPTEGWEGRKNNSVETWKAEKRAGGGGKFTCFGWAYFTPL